MMKSKLLLLTTAIGSLIVLSPVLAADTSGKPSNSTVQTSAASSGMQSSSEPSMTCQQMMDKAKPMMASMTDPTKKSMVMHEMSTAKDAMRLGHTPLCKSHMRKAMDAMK